MQANALYRWCHHWWRYMHHAWHDLRSSTIRHFQLFCKFQTHYAHWMQCTSIYDTIWIVALLFFLFCLDKIEESKVRLNLCMRCHIYIIYKLSAYNKFVFCLFTNHFKLSKYENVINSHVHTVTSIMWKLIWDLLGVPYTFMREMVGPRKNVSVDVSLLLLLNIHIYTIYSLCTYIIICYIHRLCTTLKCASEKIVNLWNSIHVWIAFLFTQSHL